MENNYIICRIENYKMKAATLILKEQERDRQYIDKYYDNPDWDRERLPLNIALEYDEEHKDKKFSKYVKEYRDKNGIEGRMTINGGEKSQTNVLTQILVTASPAYMESLSPREQVKLLKNAFEHLKAEFPTYHWVEVTIHRDEHIPHLHASALPLYYDKEKDRTIFNTTKTQSGRDFYPKLQDRLHEHMVNCGWKVDRGNRHSDRKHLGVKEYKDFQDFEKEKKRYDIPLPNMTILGKRYQKDDVEKIVEERNVAYYQLEKVQQDLNNLQIRNIDLIEKLDREHKNRQDEYQLRLDYQERWDDREILQERLHELEDEHREKTKDRYLGDRVYY